MALMGSQEGVPVPKLSQELGDQGFASMVKRVSPRIGIIEEVSIKSFCRCFGKCY